MTDKSLETEVSNLKIYRQQMATDIHDLKADVKEIKDFLMGEEPKIITRKEFESHRQAEAYAKFVIAVVTAVFTSLVTWIIINELKKG